MRRYSLAMAALIGLSSPHAAWAEGDRVRGRALAIDNCSQCHVIGDYIVWQVRSFVTSRS